mmetsp:Transcript_15921/g.32677  ORF Transcript_15921/g.32677 Transcript_15921/m.32677 type:complete len:83 (+) Transcript_15921:109-357(+)
MQTMFAGLHWVFDVCNHPYVATTDAGHSLKSPYTASKLDRPSTAASIKGQKPCTRSLRFRASGWALSTPSARSPNPLPLAAM